MTTELTGKVSNLLQKDSVKIAKTEGYGLPYNNDDIRKTERSIVPIEPLENRNIGDDHELFFHSAGHIPGSVMFEVVGERKTLFTGDINVIDTRLVKKAKPVKCDVLFLEGTYAGRDHLKKRDELEMLGQQEVMARDMLVVC